MRLWKIIATVVLLIVLAMPATAAADGGLYYVAVSTTSCLNVREEPTEKSVILTTLNRGEVVEATGATSGLWIEIATDAHITKHSNDGTTEKVAITKGWVKISLLSLEEPYANRTGVVVGDGRVRLRDDPNGAFIRWVYPGDSISVLAIIEVGDTAWYRIRVDDVRGWVMKEFVETDGL